MATTTTVAPVSHSSTTLPVCMGCLVSRSEASSPQKVERALQPVSGPLHAMPQHPPRTSLFPTFQTSSQPSPSTTAHAAAAPPAYRSPVQPAIELVQSGSSKAKLCCDKCDGPHATDACPHYKKKREDHPDGKSPPLTHFHTRPSMRVAKCAVHPYSTHIFDARAYVKSLSVLVLATIA